MQPLRAAAFRQPAIRQSVLKQARPFHNSRTMLRVKVGFSKGFAIFGANRHYRKRSKAVCEFYPWLHERDKLTCHLRSPHNHPENQDPQEDPPGVASSRCCHCVRSIHSRNCEEAFHLHLSSFALFAATFAMGRKLFTDKTLRLKKNPPKEH